MSETKSEFMSCLMSALSNCSIYSKDHPFVQEFSLRALKIAEDLYIDDKLTITLLGETLFINDEPLSTSGLHIKNFIKKTRRKGIDRIIFKRSVQTGEFIDFVASMSGQDKVISFENISIGTIEVRVRHGGEDISSLVAGGMNKAKEAYTNTSRFRSLNVFSLEEAVAGFISAIKREGNVLKLLGPVKSHSEYTYVHITNVSILTIFQAEIMGLKGNILYEAGIAGLLHDIGKIFISEGILEKKGSLSVEEWEEIKKHPIYGALYLSTLPEVPWLAAIAAFEHHMKYDGSGYPDTRSYRRKPHMISQMVALADFFDALRTHRAYRDAIQVLDVLKMIRNLRGKDFDPMVVDTFIYGLQQLGIDNQGL